MANLSSKENEELRRLLQDAVVKCSERCLYQSAKWAAELLNSLPQSTASSPADTEVDSPMSNGDWDYVAVPTIVTRNENVKEARLEAAEAHRYLMAKAYFDCREYDRCAAVFLPMTLPKGDITTSSSVKQKPQESGLPASKGKQKAGNPPNPSDYDSFRTLSQKSLFLALYAKYLSGEKRKDEESEMILGPSDGGATVNRELVGLGAALQTFFASQSERVEDGQGWLEYLYGIVLVKGKNDVEAKKWLTRSVHLYPFNWGAWQELGSLLGTIEDLHALVAQLPQNIMSFLFHIYANQELFQAQDHILNKLKEIKTIFPTSTFLKTQKALLYYHAKDFEKAEHIFSKIVQADPLRIDDLDTYSNILYVMDKRPKLAFLAQLATSNDKFRPETCCVVGNYYAMKSEHEKAVMYFRRALVLDRNFLSAWTLMGHEYVEMKNTQAAIECYRRAVDVNRKDFRAWYGLGQTYEVLEMSYYALFYYQKAAALSPYDPKMWSAVGSCLAKMQRYQQAIKAYKRALVAGSYYEAGSSFGSAAQGSERNRHAIMDPEVLFGIACMYDRLGIDNEVRSYLELTLAQEEPSEAEEEESMLKTSMSGSVASALPSGEKPQGVGVTATTSKARMWLAKIEFSKGGMEGLSKSMVLANELCQDGFEVEEAKALIRDIRSRMTQEFGEVL